MNEAIQWHSNRASEFEKNYEISKRFARRRVVWANLTKSYIRSDSVVLDIGCGPGVIACDAAAHVSRVVGIDASSQMVQLARNRAAAKKIYNIDFSVSDVAGISEIEGERLFDAILCSSVLEYVEDIDATLAAMSLRLRSGGKLIVSMPNAASVHRMVEAIVFWAFRLPSYYALVQNMATPRKFERKLERMGMRTLDVSFYGGVEMNFWIGRQLNNCSLVQPLFVAVAEKR